ncbi:hypothetical protein PFMG_01838 [Plasmodium falciparum IGH-CR14]|uniref:Heptatricopeptide repeat-containing protein, putative n=5 Tax=Plasmodium falciparum TaxID=5833 RepID=Q8I2R5_PLAF7|nr:heptatricopeptide repeat-containing protein, putative [Plasmodium falciparum 3D7]KAF4330667.1 hypothetical protein CYL21_1044 [Plasmodium falciparum NF54]KNG75674.1 hypothetical protein PFMG_01838 [Plasmodium falciparum IGH-CR14]PKC45111.1 hypothetical protein CK202_4106 [Plasmodium falciparum NF54]CAD51924.1 heptatricopeptide repeat-containing protein, putative [Plasmodium falciparum 3D7]|eukprot:XP_001352113.1 conserved Plasmodium protein, unknown function [Plasmodium falciparum 3D7]
MIRSTYLRYTYKYRNIKNVKENFGDIYYSFGKNNYTRVEKKKYDVNCCKNIEDIKDEKDLEYFFYNYDKTNIDDIFNDYKYLINCKNHQKECSRKEMFEKAYIIKYISNNVQLFHFIKSKNIFHENKPPLQGDNNNNNNFKNFANFNNNHYNIWNQTNRYCGDQKYGQQNIYYIHNIEKAKINKEEILKNKDKNKCLQYVFDNDVYKFITHIKKCDIWNYKDKIVHKNYIHYHIFFPITYMDIEKRENCKMNTQNISYYINSNIFLHDVHRYNKDIFIDVIKKMNYKLLNSQDIKNLLIILTLLHHNNISFSTEKNNIIKNNNHDNTNNKIIYKNKEYINKRIFMDMFTNIYKTICSKRNNISFIYLYDYLLIMTLNEIKNKEYYISIVETLSNYMNLINKITNNNNNNNNNNDNNIGDNHNNENIIYNNNNENIIYNNNCDSVLGSNSYNFYHNHENNTKQTYNKMNEQNKNYPQTEINLDHVITNSLNESHTCNIENIKRDQNDNHNNFINPDNIYDDDDVNRNFYDISKNDYLKNGEVTINNNASIINNIIDYENKSIQLSKRNYIYLQKKLYTIKNILISKILLIYIMKYIFGHIDNNILYAHSDLICENLELIPPLLVTNFIFTIGTCKYIDEFCMFMLAKYVQNNIQKYTCNEISIIVNTYADASLEDVSFYETICDYMKWHFNKFSSIDIIKIIYAFSKVRIRDIELLKMSYEKINHYLIEREKKFNITAQLKIIDFKKKKENRRYIQSQNYLKVSKNVNNEQNYYHNNEQNYYHNNEQNYYHNNAQNYYHNNMCNNNTNILKNKENIKKNNYIINKYLCAYALIAAGKLDYVENVDKLFVHLKESIINDGIDIRGILWMPIAITSFLSSQCIFNFLPIYINLISQAFKKTQSPKLLSLLIRRHNILLHTIQTDIIPKKYIDQRTLNNLYHICKSKKDNSKEKLFVPDSSTFHIEVSNALLSLDIPHQKEVNIYPFTIDIYIQTSQNVSEQQLKKDNSYGEYHLNQHNLHTKLNKTNTFSYEHDTNFEQTFENKKVKHKSKNKNEVYTEIPFM